MQVKINLVDVSDIFNFFLLGEVEGGVQGAGRGGDRFFLIENARKGAGVLQEGEGPGGCLLRIGEFFLGGGGLNIFLGGRNVHQE